MEQRVNLRWSSGSYANRPALGPDFLWAGQVKQVCMYKIFTSAF